MSELMNCQHKESQVRLVSWAYDCKGQHEQGFRPMNTCKSCGQVVNGLKPVSTYIDRRAKSVGN